MHNEMKLEVVNLALGSTAYGVPNLFRSKRLFNKMYWICFLIMSSAASFYFIYIEITSYLSFDVFTIVKSVYDQPALFPTVTFCDRINYFSGVNLSQLVLNTTRFGYDPTVGTNPENHFQEFYSEEYGKCFRFNSGKNMTNHTIAIKNSTIGGRDDCFNLRIGPSYNLIVWVHNQTNKPKIQNRNNHDDAFLTSNGTRLYIAVDKTFET